PEETTPEETTPEETTPEETTPEETTPEETTPEETTPEETTPEETTPEETTPEETTPEESTPEETTPEETTPEESSLECSSSSIISPVIVDSSTSTKNYDRNSPFMVPCSGDSFDATFQVTSVSDVFIAITDSNGFTSSAGVVEVQVGLLSGRNSVRRGRYSSKRSTVNTFSKRDSVGTISISYSNSVLSVRLNGRLVISYSLKNYDASQLFIASTSGALSVTGGSVSCNAEDFCNAV
ncbi:hypothetical protein AYI68_g7016, partial [Smittium mucronatum]